MSPIPLLVEGCCLMQIPAFAAGETARGISPPDSAKEEPLYIVSSGVRLSTSNVPRELQVLAAHLGGIEGVLHSELLLLQFCLCLCSHLHHSTC